MFIVFMVPGGKKSHFGPPTCISMHVGTGILLFVIVVVHASRRDEA